SHRAASRGGSRLKAAEAARAPLILGNRGFECLAREVGPIGIDEDELAIGELPQQKIAQAELPARADQQVWIWQIGSVEIGAEPLRRDVGHVERAFGYG